MSNVRDLHKKWSREADYRAAYDKLEPEFELARALIAARVSAGLTQVQLAERMKTTQSPDSESVLRVARTKHDTV